MNERQKCIIVPKLMHELFSLASRVGSETNVPFNHGIVEESERVYWLAHFKELGIQFKVHHEKSVLIIKISRLASTSCVSVKAQELNSEPHHTNYTVLTVAEHNTTDVNKQYAVQELNSEPHHTNSTQYLLLQSTTQQT
ncbi:hypothetical protein C0J52_15589 [Blattella germanica]|nr:hypothetical protein C0J52_15589 [Blattella germanica]